MKQSYIYTLAFTLLSTAIVTFVLAGVYTILQPRIITNQLQMEQYAILSAFGIDVADEKQINVLFTQYVAEIQVGDLQVYALRDDTGITNLALPFTGAGLWGTIQGYLAVSADLSHITGLEFTKQNETPGLGSRITEAWFKEQFRGIQIQGTKAVTADATGEPLINVITGATSSSNAVLRIINETIESHVAQLEVLL